MMENICHSIRKELNDNTRRTLTRAIGYNVRQDAFDKVWIEMRLPIDACVLIAVHRNVRDAISGVGTAPIDPVNSAVAMFINAHTNMHNSIQKMLDNMRAG